MGDFCWTIYTGCLARAVRLSHGVSIVQDVVLVVANHAGNEELVGKSR